VTTTTYEAASTFASHAKLILPKLPKVEESGGANGIRQAGFSVPVGVVVCVDVADAVGVKVGVTVDVGEGVTVAGAESIVEVISGSSV
jgi:hypothetical protein